MEWSGERLVPVPAAEVADRLAAGGAVWLLPFLRLAAERFPRAATDPAPGGAHWYRLGPRAADGGVRLVWRPPEHPSRFNRFRGRFEVREGPPAVLALCGTTEGGDELGDAMVLGTLLDLLARAFEGASCDDPDPRRVTPTDSG